MDADRSAPHRRWLEGGLAVLAVAVLTAAATPSVVETLERSRHRDVVESVRQLQTALSDYYADTGSLATLVDLGAFDGGSAADRHFVSGDGAPGWDGPYLASARVESAAGGRFSLEVLRADQAILHLGDRGALGDGYEALLRALDDALDGDRDVTRGVVWGDGEGVHVGINVFRG